MKIKFDKRIEVVFVCFALLGIVGREWVLPQISWPIQILLFFISLLIINGVWIFHYVFNEWLNQRLPLEKGITKRIVVQLLGGWAVVQTILILAGTAILDYMLPEIESSINRLNVIALGVGAFMVNIVMGLGFITSNLFNRWQENVMRAARLEKEKSQVQYDNLKNQLNPHFLFNSLSSLDSLIDDNPVLARQFLGQLSKVFRYVLQHKDKELVPLETELTFIKNYVSLLQTRFDGMFQLHCAIGEEMLERQIVPVTLQILIENAIKHNVISEAQPLVVQLTTNDGYLEVANPVQRKKQIVTSNGQGLQNLQQLYGYLSPKPVQIIDDGVTFRVQVPILP